MGTSRTDRRRRNLHAFRPCLDGQERLEERALLSVASPQIVTGLYHPIKVFAKNGGKAVRILNGHGSAFDVSLSGGPGVIRAHANYDGTVNLILYGTSLYTEMDINPAPERVIKQWIPRQAHEMHPEFGSGNNLLNVKDITVKSGTIGALLGYRTATLSGSVVVAGTNPVDRIAFDQLAPGATIKTGGDLNTLDVYNNATLSGAGTGIFVGQDLNLLNVGGNLTLSNGAKVSVTRDIGDTPQPPKGSGTGSSVLQALYTFTTAITTVEPLVGGYIKGNMSIDPTSSFTSSRVDQLMFVLGNLSGAVRIAPSPVFYNQSSSATPPPLNTINLWWVTGTIS